MTVFIPQELYDKPLSACVEHVGNFPLVRHPYYCGFPMPEHAPEIFSPTRLLEYKSAERADARGALDVHRYVFIHERPFRFDALLDAQHWAPTPRVWLQCAGDVWVDSEGPGRNAAVWKMCVFGREDVRDTMSDEDAAQYDCLPARLAVYRGAHTPRYATRGLSWTTDRAKAEWFARRYARGRVSYVASAEVPKATIRACFSARGENEVILVRRPHHALAERRVP